MGTCKCSCLNSDIADDFSTSVIKPVQKSNCVIAEKLNSDYTPKFMYDQIDDSPTIVQFKELVQDLE